MRKKIFKNEILKLGRFQTFLIFTIAEEDDTF